MKNERAVCDRNSDLKGNLLVWITSKQLKLHQKHKMALIQYCLSATWRLSFLSHFWAEKSPSLMNGARFCIQICRNDGLILDLHCRQKNFHLRKCCIFPVFDPRNSLFGEIASYQPKKWWFKTHFYAKINTTTQFLRISYFEGQKRGKCNIFEDENFFVYNVDRVSIHLFCKFECKILLRSWARAIFAQKWERILNL